MGEMVASKDVPIKAHPHVMALRIKEKYNLGRFFYMDLWPITAPILYCFDPELSAQFTTDFAAPKHPQLAKTLEVLAGKDDLVASNGPLWKRWRSIFNPGFAGQHLMTLAPGIVDDVEVFAEKMAARAKDGRAFRLEEEATRLTVDIIGKVAMDLRLDTQKGDNAMVNAFRDQVQLLPTNNSLDPLSMWWPSGIYRRWRNARIMNAYIGEVLEERFEQRSENDNKAGGGGRQRKRAIIDLALESYKAEQATNHVGKAKLSSKTLDPEFRQNAITQIRTFLFAGHDTTSSVICYALYLLQKRPATLSRIRAEHSAVLGPVSSTADTLKHDPHLVNKLEYTTCVIKETLRLFPPASSARATAPGLVLRDPKTGEALPQCENILFWLVHYAMHHDTALWGPSANAFQPERFLSPNLPKNAWRPFEQGPRNCIGQDLAMLEARIALALVVRRFEFSAAFDALEELAGDGSVYAKDPKWRQGKQDLDGEEAYPVLIGTAKPREGMPMKVREVQG